MRKINVAEIAMMQKTKEGRIGFRYPISEALGRQPQSTDLTQRHPFEVEILQLPARSVAYRFNSYSAHWEYYQVVSGMGVVRHAHGETPVVEGEAFLFRPGEPHQVRNDSDMDLIVLIVADNPR